MASEDQSFDQARAQLGHVAELRGLGWGTLALGFYEPTERWITGLLEGEVAADFRKAVGWLDGDRQRFEDPLAMLGGWSGEMAERDPAAVLRDLKVEYARLFIGAPGPMEAPPYESLYRDRDADGSPIVSGPSTVAVERTYGSYGLERAAGHTDLPDHVATELEFMHFLCSRERQAWQGGEVSDARTLRSAQNAFVTEHLNKWLPEFSERVLGATHMDVYRALATLLQDFLAVEAGGGYARETLRGVFGEGGQRKVTGP